MRSGDYTTADLLIHFTGHITGRKLIDIGLNLSHDSFDHDRDEVVQRALDHGVAGFILTGASEDGATKAFELTKIYPEISWSTAGIHPHYSNSWNDGTAEHLRQLLRYDKVVAVGECGLDHFRNFSTPKEQEHAFREQLQLAVETQKPLFLHQRDAHDDFLRILKDYWDDSNGGVAHCFTGTKEHMRDYLDLGLYIGITGWVCDERRGHDLQEAVKYLPADRMLIETDAPYLLPRDLKPKPKTRRNEPMYLGHILGVIALLRNENANALAEITTQNTKNLFKI